MGNILYVLAAILILFWAVGFYVFNVGAIIHILPVIAAVSIGYKFFEKKEIAE